MSLQATTSQTVGPYFRIGLAWQFREDLTAPGVVGERVEIEGRVLDADSKPVNDAMVEIWQANSHGKYNHPDDAQQKPLESGFLGYGRVPTDDNGRFHFVTIKPGPVPDPDGKLQAPHIAVSVFSRGLLRRLVSRIYFPDELANTTDYVMNLVPPSRRHTLIAKRGPRDGLLEWNVILQGPNETVFFDV
jgi:protocatechuate 3,4-dioxygenase alpha subunit